MKITLTGSIDLEDIKEIVHDNLDSLYHNGGLTLYIPFDSWQAVMQTHEVQQGLIWMSPENLTKGEMSLYGATVAYYFPHLFEEAEN